MLGSNVQHKTRKCKKCNVDFVLSNKYFHKDPSNKEGFKLRCKTCQKAFSDESKINKLKNQYDVYINGNKLNPEHFDISIKNPNVISINNLSIKVYNKDTLNLIANSESTLSIKL